MSTIYYFTAVILLSFFNSCQSQQVNVTIFTESQCPFCTRLLREQVWPFHATHPGIANIQARFF